MQLECVHPTVGCGPYLPYSAQGLPLLTTAACLYWPRIEDDGCGGETGSAASNTNSSSGGGDGLL